MLLDMTYDGPESVLTMKNVIEFFDRTFEAYSVLLSTEIITVFLVLNACHFPVIGGVRCKWQSANEK